MIEVSLTMSELRIAAEVAIQRQCQNLKAGRVDRFGHDPRGGGWNPHVEGAAGEMAVAKYLGVYWSGALGNLKADDVAHYQVRTRSRHDYELILHPTDPDDRKFVLVTGTAPAFRLVGWTLARDGKAEKFWKDPAGGRAAFFVPHAALHPMATLSRAA